MSKIRSRGNRETELKVVAILRSARIAGWRRHQPVPGRPDFVFPVEQLALFVDGCFWHGCANHCRIPGTNTRYWTEKIARNVTRDRATARALRRAGRRVLRVWSHALRHPDRVRQRIIKALSDCREQGNYSCAHR